MNTSNPTVPADRSENPLQWVRSRVHRAGKWRALILTIAMHLVLLLVLVVGIHWQTKPASEVAIEVVRSVPQPQAETPRSVTPPPAERPQPTVDEPPPPPKKADILIKDKKAEKPPERTPEKPIQKAPEKVQPKVDPQQARIQQQLAEEERRLQQQKAQQEAQRRKELLNSANAEVAAMEQDRAKQAAAAAALKGARESYIGKISAKIRGKTVVPPGLAGSTNPQVEVVFAINQLPSGEVVSVVKRRSSGNPQLDDAVERAIWNSSPLPKPERSDIFERVLELKHKPLLNE